MIRANGAAARNVIKNIFYTNNNFKKLHRSVEVMFKVKFGNPKYEAYFTIFNF